MVPLVVAEDLVLTFGIGAAKFAPWMPWRAATLHFTSPRSLMSAALAGVYC